MYDKNETSAKELVTLKEVLKIKYLHFCVWYNFKRKIE
jgi:hypothetical protein